MTKRTRPIRAHKTHRAVSIPFITWTLVATCTVCHLAQLDIVPLPEDIETILVPTSRAALDAHLWHTTLTYAWLHANPVHLLSNMALLISVGSVLERSRMRGVMLISYLAGAVAGAVAFAQSRPAGDPTQLVGASAAIFSLVGTYLMSVTRLRMRNSGTFAQRRYLEDQMRRTIWLVIYNLLYGTLIATGVSNVAHIGGFVAGILVAVAMTPIAAANERREETHADHRADPIRWP